MSNTAEADHLNLSAEDVADPLKALDQVCEADVRKSAFPGGIGNLHQALDDMNLSGGVPLDVRQLFETAKNVSLYSFFVYRFHQVAELVAFTALELALKHRHQIEFPESASARGLAGLLRLAQQHGWIQNEGFKGRENIARTNAEIRKAMDLIESGVLDEGETVEIEDPTTDEIDQALRELDLVDGIVNSAAKIRNALAHGSSMLHPGSVATLRMTADIINQLFTKRDQARE